jgi:hypothetical protein
MALSTSLKLAAWLGFTWGAFAIVSAIEKLAFPLFDQFTAGQATILPEVSQVALSCSSCRLPLLLALASSALGIGLAVRRASVSVHHLAYVLHSLVWLALLSVYVLAVVLPLVPLVGQTQG